MAFALSFGPASKRSLACGSGSGFEPETARNRKNLVLPKKLEQISPATRAQLPATRAQFSATERTPKNHYKHTGPDDTCLGNYSAIHDHLHSALVCQRKKPEVEAQVVLLHMCCQLGSCSRSHVLLFLALASRRYIHCDGLPIALLCLLGGRFSPPSYQRNDDPSQYCRVH